MTHGNEEDSEFYWSNLTAKFDQNNNTIDFKAFDVWYEEIKSIVAHKYLDKEMDIRFRFERNIDARTRNR